MSGGAALFNFLSLLIVTPVVAFYILVDWHRMIAKLDSWLPLDHRESLRNIAREINHALAGFIRGQSIVCLFLGIWYSVGLTLIGLDYGFLIGVVGGLLSFVPYVGSLTALVLSLAAIGLAHLGVIDLDRARAFVAGIDFSGLLLHGMLSFLLFANEISFA